MSMYNTVSQLILHKSTELFIIWKFMLDITNLGLCYNLSPLNLQIDEARFFMQCYLYIRRSSCHFFTSLEGCYYPNNWICSFLYNLMSNILWAVYSSRNIVYVCSYMHCIEGKREKDTAYVLYTWLRFTFLMMKNRTSKVYTHCKGLFKNYSPHDLNYLQ